MISFFIKSEGNRLLKAPQMYCLLIRNYIWTPNLSIYMVNISNYLKMNNFKILQARCSISCIVMKILNDLKLILIFMVTIYSLILLYTLKSAHSHRLAI